jgi:hypothetical protein
MPISNSTDRFNGVVASKAIKVRCVVGAESNVALLSGEQTIDGVAVVEFDRVLLTAQTDPIENGVYNVQISLWTRAADWDGNRDVELGSTVWAGRLAGSDQLWQLTAPAGNIVIGNTSVTITLLLDPDAATASDLQQITDVGFITTNPLHIDGSSLLLTEVGAAPVSSVATVGQLWVRNDVPGILMFTDDLGNDFEITSNLLPAGTVVDSTLHWDGADWIEYVQLLLQTDKLQVPNNYGMNWLDDGAAPLEMLAFTETSGDPLFGQVVALLNFEQALTTNIPPEDFGDNESNNWLVDLGTWVVATNANMQSTGVLKEQANTQMRGFDVSPDGLHFITCEPTTDHVWSYTLDNPYDFENATVDNPGGANQLNPETCTWEDSGARYMIVHDDTIFMYNTDSAYKITTAGVTSETSSLAFSNFPIGSGTYVSVWLDPTGTHLMLHGNYPGSTEQIVHVILSTPFDLTWSTSANISESYDTETPGEITSGSDGMEVSPDGVYIIIGNSQGYREKYKLSTPWDVSTAVWQYDLPVRAGSRFYTEYAENIGSMDDVDNSVRTPDQLTKYQQADNGDMYRFDRNLVGAEVNYFNEEGSRGMIVDFRQQATMNGDNVKFGSGSAHFDLAITFRKTEFTDLLKIGYSAGDSASMMLDGGEDFCIEGWVYFDDLTTVNNERITLAVHATASPNLQNFGYYIVYDSGDPGYELVANVGTTGVTQAMPTDPVTDQWYHWALQRRGGNLEMLWNGVREHNSAYGFTVISDPGVGLSLGGYDSAGDGTNHVRGLAGQVDSFRMTIGSTRYPDAGTYTVPTAAFPDGGVKAFTVGDPSANTVIDGITTEVTGLLIFPDACGDTLKLNEAAAAIADEDGKGQFWVRDDVPNTPMFTDDAGEDFVLNSLGGKVLTDLVTATPPTTEGVTGNFVIFDADDDDLLASVGFNVGNDLELFNHMEGGDLRLKGINATGDEIIWIEGKTDGILNIRSAGDISLFDGRTGTDLFIRMIAGDDVVLYDNATQVARTNTTIAGGLEAFNAYNGEGGQLTAWERVLTLSDVDFTATATFQYTNLTTDSAPNQFEMKMSSNNPALAVWIIFDDETYTEMSADWMLGTLAIGDLLTMRSETRADRWSIYRVNGAPEDNSTWWKIPVEVVRVGTIFGATRRVRVTPTFGLGTVDAVLSAVVRTDIVTATPPVSESVTGFYDIFDADATDRLGQVGFNSSNDLELKNFFHGGSVYIRGENAAGSEIDYLAGHPAGNLVLRGVNRVEIGYTNFEVGIEANVNLGVKLYYNNLLRFEAANSGRCYVYSDGSTDSEQRTIEFRQQGGSVRGRIGHISNDIFYVRNQIDSGNVIISAADSASAEHNILHGDPDGAATLYYDGVAQLATATDGAELPSAGVMRFFKSDNLESYVIEFGAGGGNFLNFEGTTGAFVFSSGGEVGQFVEIDLNTGDESGQIFVFATHDDASGALALQNNGASGTQYSALELHGAGFGGLYSPGTLLTWTDAQADLFIAGTSGAGPSMQFNITGGVKQVDIADGSHLRIIDGGETDIVDIYHDGTSLFIEGTLTTSIRIQPTAGEDSIVATANGAVVLYHDGVQVLRTIGTGAQVLSTTDDNPTLQWYQDDGVTRNLFISAFGAGDVTFGSEIHGGSVIIRGEDSGGSPTNILVGDPDGQTNLYYDGTLAFSSVANGIKIWDGALVDNLQMSGDGSDWNFIFTSISDVNFTGFTGPGALRIDGGFKMESAGPNLEWNQTTAAADNGRWNLFAISEQLSWGPSTDGGTVDNFMTVDRTGNTTDLILWECTDFEIDADVKIVGDVGFYDTTPVAQSAAYTRNATIVESRTLLQSSAATATNNNNVLAALIADLQALGLIG